MFSPFKFRGISGKPNTGSPRLCYQVETRRDRPERPIKKKRIDRFWTARAKTAGKDVERRASVTASPNGLRGRRMVCFELRAPLRGLGAVSRPRRGRVPGGVEIGQRLRRST